MTSPTPIDVQKIFAAAVGTIDDAGGADASYLDSGPADKRILCDCDGTLFDVRGATGGQQLNEELFAFLYMAKKNGFNVTIHTNTVAGNIDRVKLFSKVHFGDSMAFEVIDKNETVGVRAAIIFDDDHSTHAAKSPNKWEPRDPRMLELLSAMRQADPAFKVIRPFKAFTALNP